jgi:hypothetical protein
MIKKYSQDNYNFKQLIEILFECNEIETLNKIHLKLKNNKNFKIFQVGEYYKEFK